METLTIFTTCKPFVGPAAVHQRNALASWTLQEPRPDVVVFGDEEGAEEEAERLGLRHVGYVQRDAARLPFLDSIFGRAQRLAFGDLLAYSNADIILVGDLAAAAARCAAAFPAGFLGVCRRWDVDLDGPLAFGGDWRWEAWRAVWDGGELYTPCSSDVFLFKRPLPWSLLPFVGGRGRWDNWMLAEAVRTRTPVVDLTAAVLLVHPRHEGSGEARKAVDKDESGQNNAALAVAKLFCLKHVARAGALWEMAADGETRKV